VAAIDFIAAFVDADRWFEYSLSFDVLDNAGYAKVNFLCQFAGGLAL